MYTPIQFRQLNKVQVAALAALRHYNKLEATYGPYEPLVTTFQHKPSWIVRGLRKQQNHKIWKVSTHTMQALVRRGLVDPSAFKVSQRGELICQALGATIQ